MKNKNLLVIVFIIIVMVFCGYLRPAIAGIEAVVSDYKPNLNAYLKNIKEYNEQTITIQQITMENNSGLNAFDYKSDDLNVTYRTGAIQNFLWYTLKKSFESIGMKAKEYIAPVKNVCELNLVFTTFNADKTTFTMSLSRNGYLLMQKEITVSPKPLQSTKINDLEKRQYDYFDSIAVSILDDADFKKAFFSDKGKI